MSKNGKGGRGRDPRPNRVTAVGFWHPRSRGSTLDRTGLERRGLEMSGEDRPLITCRELLDFLYLYLEDELPEERRGEFDRHLAVCPPCRAYIRQYQDSIRLGKAAFEPPESSLRDVPEELVQAILQARSRR